MFYGDGADLAETEAMARKIGAILPARRDRGPARRPALLPVPDLRRVGGGPWRAAPRPGASPGCVAAPPPPTDPVELLDDAAPSVRADRGGHAASGGRAPGLVRRPRPALPPAAPVRRPARDDDDRGTARPRRRDRGLDPRRRPRRARGGELPASDPADDRRPRGRHRADQRDLVRPPLHRAAAPPGRRGRRERPAQAVQGHGLPSTTRSSRPSRATARCSTRDGSCRSTG